MVLGPQGTGQAATACPDSTPRDHRTIMAAFQYELHHHVDEQQEKRWDPEKVRSLRTAGDDRQEFLADLEEAAKRSSNKWSRINTAHVTDAE